MNRLNSLFIIGLLLIGVNVFADDVWIDSDGNVTTGISSSGNLEVSGASAERGVAGIAIDTGGEGVYGENTTLSNTNYGILGHDQYGVYGLGSPYAGYFEGDAMVTGDLTVGNLIGYTESDPLFSLWDRSTGITVTESQITDLNHFTTGDETDPQVGTLIDTKWCTSNGSLVNCTNDPPSGGGGDGHSLDAADGTPTDALFVDNDGNVGIGTTTPTESLTVNGTIETSGGVKFPDGVIQTASSGPTWHQVLPAAERFVLVMGGVAVLDKETGLVWEQSPSQTLYTWSSAASYACNYLALGNRKGWHLPTVEQLASLVDTSQPWPVVPALPIGHPFDTDCASGGCVQWENYYWSANTGAGGFTGAWAVHFIDGSVNELSKSYGTVTAWCVRGGQSVDFCNR